MSGNGTVMNEWKFREQMCEIGRRIYNKGFAAANDGNISFRLGEDRVLCSPTRVSKGFMKPDDLCIVDLDGKQVSGKRKRSSEILLHLTIMKARADVRSVVHCHPPHATAFAVAREPIPKCVLPEIEVFLGEVAISPYETPGGQSFADTVLPYVKDTDTILLANHGTRHLRQRPGRRLFQDRDHRRLLPHPDPGQADRQGELLHGREGGRADQAQAQAGHPRPAPGARARELRPVRQQPVPRRIRRVASPEPRVFIHPKIAGSEPARSPIEGVLDAARRPACRGRKPRRASAPAPRPRKPSSNGQATSGGRSTRKPSSRRSPTRSCRP